MSRERLEAGQVWFYLAAVLIGLGLGGFAPGFAARLDVLVWPLIALLLFATFSQIPLRSVGAVFAERRVLLAAILGNFVVLPAAAFALVNLAGRLPLGPEGGTGSDALRLGLLLVLLVPCTDWFITFTQLGRGDGALATALTPVSLLLQLLLLPLYLWLMTGSAGSVVTLGQVGPAVGIVLGPLLAAAVLERWWVRPGAGQRVRERLGWWPVPLLAVVILVVAASHAGDLGEIAGLIPVVAVVALLFATLAVLLAVALTQLLRLRAAQGRTLAFSFATRNSFVVLPFALALPTGWEIAAMVIVIQSLVELLAMALLVWFVPRVALPDRRGATDLA